MTATLTIVALDFGAPTVMADSSVTTDRPDLRSVTATGPRQLRACFDGPIASTFNFSDFNFFLTGYAQKRRTGQDAGFAVSGQPQVDTTNRQCALINFFGNGDVRSYSLATIGDSVVTDTSGRTNRRNSVPLDGSFIPPSPGRTPAPDPVRFAVTIGADVLDRSLMIEFDEPLRNIADLRSLGFYSDDPNDSIGFHPANRVISFQRDSTQVTVGFAAADSAFLPRLARAVALQGAVTGQEIEDSTFGTLDERTRISTRPQLGAIGLMDDEPLTYAFDFEQPVSQILDPTKFIMFDGNGGIFLGRPTNQTPGFPRIDPDNPRRVIVQVGERTRGADRGQIVIGGVLEGAIATDQRQPDGRLVPITNLAGTLPMVPQADHPGLTTGPDLLYVDFQKDRPEAYFYFDEPVAYVNMVDNEDTGTSIDNPDFYLYDQAGTRYGAEAPSDLIPIILPGDPATTSDNTVLRVTFSQEARERAVAAEANQAVVGDRTDRVSADKNPLWSTVPNTLRPSGAGEAPVNQPPPTTPTTAPNQGNSQPQPAARRSKTSNTGIKLSIRRKRSKKTGRVYEARYVGSVRSGSRLCKPGRLIQVRRLKRGGSGFVVVRRIYTKDNGTFKFTLRGKNAGAEYELFAPEVKVSNETRDVTCRAANK